MVNPLFTLLPISALLLSSVPFPATGDDDDHLFGKSIHPKTLGLKKEKLSHFRFHWHDVLSGEAPTSVTVISPPRNSTTGFGTANMIDNPLTLRPELTSKCVGMAQGSSS
ncbi:hypothetical protein DM860_009851 [Cuscuta australis]|uniref:Dirigent protein n=1 Tax=Cuscuta australis TaxID=267555 RepID=A0A328DFT2_9ASTE|nr:hypothetical protein DM860_009851 [Cuscuta australis]